MSEKLSQNKTFVLEDGRQAEILEASEAKSILTEEVKKQLIQSFISEESRNKVTGILGEPTHEATDEEIERDMTAIDKMLENDRFFVLTVDGKAAGMIGFDSYNKLKDGRDIFMGRMLLVLPEFRKQGLAGKLSDYAYADFQAKHPDNPMLSYTRNKTVKEARRKMGWEEVGEDGALIIEGHKDVVDEDPEKWRKRKEELGWTAFFYDPKEAPTLSLESRPPYEMTLAEFTHEYDTLMQRVAKKEKKGRLDPDATPYEPVSAEEAALLKKDWKEFSRKRGFSEEDIVEYERWLVISGQSNNLEGAINDPWRRSRSNWPQKLWKMHVEKAKERGVILSDEIQRDYEKAQESPTIVANESSDPVPSANEHEDAEDVW